MKKFRMLAALCAAFVISLSFTTVAYAGGSEETTEETAVTESAVDETNPLTPDGTGTVLDSATNEDGKQFYTITTPAGNIFYLIIDLERDSDNVYFLDAVTEKDLLALAEQSEDAEEDTGTSAIPDTDNTAAATTPEPEAETESDTNSDAEPETNNGGGSSIVIIVLIVLAAGGAGYYFKIYRPKHELTDSGDEYEDGNEYEADAPDTYEEDTDDDDDGPPWDEDEEEYAGDNGEEEK